MWQQLTACPQSKLTKTIPDFWKRVKQNGSLEQQILMTTDYVDENINHGELS